MKTTIKPDSMKVNEVKSLTLKWKLMAACLPLIAIVLMLACILPIKEKVVLRYHHADSSYRAGDIALYVAMPLLNVVVK